MDQIKPKWNCVGGLRTFYFVEMPYIIRNILNFKTVRAKVLLLAQLQQKTNKKFSFRVKY
jgi:hypothetical protein